MTDLGERARAGPRTGVALWSTAAWRHTAELWLDEQLASLGIRRTGAVEQPHLRPWATALRAPTTIGPVWLKAASAGTATEIRLYELLVRVVPDHVLAPLAIDVRRDWILLPDGGPTLHPMSEDELVPAMVEVMPAYAELQRALALQLDQLLAVGVTDMRPAILPARFDEALDVAAGSFGAMETADRESYERVLAFRDQYVALCQRLSGLPGSSTLDHNDLYPHNILYSSSSGTSRVRFFDWGDSLVAHPFASMLVALGGLQSRLELDIDDPVLRRVRDAYLDGFRDLASPAELVETLEVACRVAKVARALTWQRSLLALAAASSAERDRLARIPFDTVVSVLDDSYLGVR